MCRNEGEQNTTEIFEEAVMALLKKLNDNRDRIRALYEAMSREVVAERREWEASHANDPPR
jgi:hypothetical protein